MPATTTALIADDSEDIRELIAVFLSRAGFQTTVADDGIPALAAARRERPEIYVLDVRMPGMNGLDLCRELKADPSTSAPVLLVSAECSEANIAAGFAAGCDGYLAKPFSRRDLVERVAGLVGCTVG